jgi:AraC-like DNA-binding protein
VATLDLDCVEASVESAESPLGSWLSARWSPTADSPLYGIVERIWYFDGMLTHERERVFPDGSAELIVMLDEPHRDGDTEVPSPFPPVCINGIRTRPSVVVAPAGRCRVLGIRVHAIGACRLLHEPMTDLVDVTIDLQQSLGRMAAELGERCATAAQAFAWNNTRNARGVLGVAIDWLCYQIAKRDDADRAVSWSAHEIRRARGVISIDEIAAHLGMPRALFARRFSDFVGVTPKRFARILRFHNALALIGRGQGIATAAAELDYYDQSHLYRDFTEFAGMTPAAFIAARRYPGGVSLAEP